MARVLITGAAGFAGHHLVRTFADAGHDVIALDALTYAGALARIDPRARFVWGDFSHPLWPGNKLDGSFDWVIHNGAESHVTRSFACPSTFVRSNTLGTANMLDWASLAGCALFVLTSTDEVLAGSGAAADVNDHLTPANPYAATKAGAEYMARAWAACYDVPVCVTRACNLVGSGQDREKFIPLVISKLMQRKYVSVHTGADGQPGIRRWLSIQAYCDYLLHLCSRGAIGVHHAGPGWALDNLEMARWIAGILGKPLSYVLTAGTLDRPSYDESYWLDGDVWDGEFDARLEQTVRWYAERLCSI